MMDSPFHPMGESRDQYFPPGPRTSALHGALASAVNGPKWVNGQRSDIVDHGVLYPPTPHIPFPASLSGKADPFSRAVSPIHGAFDDAMQEARSSFVHSLPSAGLEGELGIGAPPQSRHDVANGVSGLHPTHELDLVPFMPQYDALFADPFASLGQSSMGIDDAALDSMANRLSISAPVSPRQSFNRADWPMDRPALRRSSSTGKVQGFADPQLPKLLTERLQQAERDQKSGDPRGSPQTPAMVHLKKIRKPDMRTLMSHGGSQAPSRQASPERSPTLFDPALDLQDGEVAANASMLDQ